jgi:glycosyltransferase involved in cell wall biosynthesis
MEERSESKLFLKRPPAADGLGARPSVAVVIPCYQVERHLEGLIPRIPAFVDWIILVDDASQDGTPDLIAELAAKDPRIIPVTHTINGGVGAAMISGFRAALKTSAGIVVKVDGDGQMAPEQIARLITPLVDERADFAKGNRFRHLGALRRMPLARRLGNLGLSFAVKLGSGYWR